MKRRQRNAEATGIAADFVERCEPVVAIERRIFHALGRYGRRKLLEPHHEIEQLTLAWTLIRRDTRAKQYAADELEHLGLDCVAALAR